MAASSTPRGMGDGEGNTFDLVSSQLDRLHDLLRDESDEEIGDPTDYAMQSTPRAGGGPEELPRVASSEDITNRLKEALLTLDRLDEAVDAFTVETYENSESESDREKAGSVADSVAPTEQAQASTAPVAPPGGDHHGRLA